LKKQREEALAKVRAEREKAHTDYMAMVELQKIIAEGRGYQSEIEEMHVKLQFLNVKVKELEDAAEFLEQRKEELDEQKKATEEQNEDLERQLKAKEEANQKRLVAKLQRDKNPEVKELVAKEEAQTESNEDFANKLREEREKLD
jgi:prefoldin subunit 5